MSMNYTVNVDHLVSNRRSVIKMYHNNPRILHFVASLLFRIRFAFGTCFRLGENKGALASLLSRGGGRKELCQGNGSCCL